MNGKIENRYLVSILAIGSVLLAGIIVVSLLNRPIPDANETLLGTIVGFIFGNMVGPVFRSIFKDKDDAAKQVTDKALDALANSAPPGSVTVQPPAEVTVTAKE